MSLMISNFILGKTLILKEKAIRIARQQNEALKEEVVNNGNNESDAETADGNHFFSGFGGLFQDTDDSTDADADNEKRNFDEEYAMKHKRERNTREETSKTEGMYFIYKNRIAAWIDITCCNIVLTYF